ncbi:MAG: YIP1 family protein [Thermodesulfobacteriota bacterium]
MKTRISCPHCGFTTEIPTKRIPLKARFASCPRCRERFPLRLQDPPSAPPPGTTPVLTGSSPDTAPVAREPLKSGRGPSPWEDRGRIGLWKGIYRSFLDTILSPGVFFRTMHTHKGLKEPLAVGILFGSIGLITGLFRDFVLSVWGYGGGVQVLSSGVDSPGLLSGIMALSPLIVCIGIFIMSGILHLFLRIFRGASQGFEGTFRVVAYGQATQIFGAVPILGGLIGGLWYLVVLIVGMREIHETSYSRVILAFLTPFLLTGAMALAVLIPLVFSLLNRLL